MTKPDDGNSHARARGPRHARESSAHRAIVEITSSLPGKHQHTQLPKPEDTNDPGYDNIQTGELDPQDLTNWRDRTIGLFFWVAWFAIGVYAWWFTDAPLIDYVVATVIWLLIFALAVIGVPLVRMRARGRANK